MALETIDIDPVGFLSDFAVHLSSCDTEAHKRGDYCYPNLLCKGAIHQA